MYAILYDYRELFEYLLPHEYGVTMSCNFMQNQQVLPAGSTILHLIVFLQNCGIPRTEYFCYIVDKIM